MRLLELPQVLLDHVAGMLCEREFYRFSLAARECRAATEAKEAAVITQHALGVVSSKAGEIERRQQQMARQLEAKADKDAVQSIKKKADAALRKATKALDGDLD